MSLFHRLAGGFHGLFRKRQIERELDEELRTYLEMSTHRKMNSGMSREEALRASRLEMGTPEMIKSEVQDVSWESTMESYWQDLRHAPRVLWKHRGFAAVALLTLSMGIGASAAMFSVVDGVLLRPLALADPDRLVTLWETSLETGRRTRVPPGNYSDWRAGADVFKSMGMYGSTVRSITGDGEPERVSGARVDDGYFPTLGVSPILGRWVLSRDTVQGAPPVVVLSYGLWQRRFGGRADVIGRIMTLDGRKSEIIGVMPRGLYPTWPVTAGGIAFQERYQQFWEPMQLGQFALNRTAHVYGVVARLRPGVGMPHAQAAMKSIAAGLAEEFPKSNAGEGIAVTRLKDEVTSSVRPALIVLLAAVGFLLIIGCANLATLSLARASARVRELAVRAALGATRLRLIRQLLIESLLLASAGGLLGLLLARAGLGTLLALIPADVPRLEDVSIDARVFAFAAALSILTAALFGALPAWKASRPDVQNSLRMDGRGCTSHAGRERTRRILVMTEIALACVLVIGAGLLGRSFSRLSAVKPGFDPSRVLVAEMSLPAGTPNEAIANTHREILGGLRSLPGVVSAAVGYDHPAESSWYDSFLIPGENAEQSRVAWLNIVSEDFAETMRIPLVSGRSFSAADDMIHPRVVIVNEAFSQRYFAGENPVGKRLIVPAPTRPDPPVAHEIIGLACDVKMLGLSVPAEPAMYLPMAQFPQGDFSLLIRTRGDPEELLPTFRNAIRAIRPDLPLGRFGTMEQIIGQSVAQPRATAMLTGLFGVVALLLAALGVYGLLEYGVSQRAKEIGVRLALGASPGAVTKAVLREGLVVALAGVAVGLTVAAGLSRLARNLLFEITPGDPLTFAATGVGLLVVVIAASCLPMRRASRIDPLDVLREN